MLNRGVCVCRVPCAVCRVSLVNRSACEIWYGVVWCGVVWCGVRFYTLEVVSNRNYLLLHNHEVVMIFNALVWCGVV